jgi:hypothetical protein
VSRKTKRPPKPPPAIIRRIVQVFEPTEEDLFQITDAPAGYVTVEDYRAATKQEAPLSEEEGF